MYSSPNRHQEGGLSIPDVGKGTREEIIDMEDRELRIVVYYMSHYNLLRILYTVKLYNILLHGEEGPLVSPGCLACLAPK